MFDSDKNESIDLKEFLEGMTTLFSEKYENIVKFIFDLYDFDRDGLIAKEDIRIVLSYVPLNTDNFKSEISKYLSQQYKDRIESQDEIFSLLEKVFMTNDKLDVNSFFRVIENVSSDILLFILVFLMQKKPFSKSLIEEFAAKNNNGEIPKSPTYSKKLIASPNIQSKFSPSVIISKSPSMKARSNLSFTGNRLGTNLNTGLENNQNLQESKNFLLKFAGPKTGAQGADSVQNIDISTPTITLNYGKSASQKGQGINNIFFITNKDFVFE